MSGIFKAYDIRGVYPGEINADVAEAIGRAYIEFTGAKKVVVGRDMRPHSEPLFEGLSRGMLAQGGDVIDLGLCSTPVSYFANGTLKADGSVMITASHNPADWNALKFIGPRGTFLASGEASELFDLYSQGSLPYRSEEALRSVSRMEGMFERHAERIFEVVDVNAIRARKFRVAVDCANGVGSLCSAEFLRKLGCEVFTLNDEIYGGFNRPPEPLPENLGELCETVRRESCDVGFGQDPDGDRLTVVTDRGEALNPHFTVALAVDQVLDGDLDEIIDALTLAGQAEKLRASAEEA